MDSVLAARRASGFGGYGNKMNALELHDAAFDSACDYAEETIGYIQEYANGAFDLTVSDQIAQKILDCRALYQAATEKNGEYEGNRYHFIEVPLLDIEL